MSSGFDGVEVHGCQLIRTRKSESIGFSPGASTAWLKGERHVPTRDHTVDMPMGRRKNRAHAAIVVATDEGAALGTHAI
jgi:hypothetical protein